MPQLDFTFYISNIFWFCLSFSLIYTSISFFASKRIEAGIRQRSENFLNLSNKIKDCKIKSDAILSLIEEVKSNKNNEIDALQKIASNVLHEKRASIDSGLSDYYDRLFSQSKRVISDFKLKILSQENDISLIIKSKYFDISKINEKRS